MAMCKNRVRNEVVPADVVFRFVTPSGMSSNGDEVVSSVKRACKAKGVYPLVFMYVRPNDQGGVYTGAASDCENLVFTGESTDCDIAEWLADVYLIACGGNSIMAMDILENVIEYGDAKAREKGYENLMDFYDKTLIEPYDRVVEMKKKSKVKELDRMDVIRELNRIIISKKKEE